MPRSQAQPTHILLDDRNAEVGRVHLTDAGEHEVRFTEAFDARATARLRMVRTLPAHGDGRPPPGRGG